MIKLNKLLTEIKVNKPVNITDKKALLNWWFDEGNIYLLSYMTHASSVEELISNEGYDNLQNYLEDYFDFEGDKVSLYETYINNYYRMFKPKEIYVAAFGDDYGTDIKGTPYKNIIIEYLGYSKYMLYCNNY